jgi:hypothetical protein
MNHESPFRHQRGVIRLVPSPGKSILQRAGDAYFRLLLGLLVLIAGCLVLTIGIYLLGI